MRRTKVELAPANENVNFHKRRPNQVYRARSRSLVRTFVPAHAMPYLLDVFGLTCSVERKKERKKENKKEMPQHQL